MLFAFPVRDSTINSASKTHPEVDTNALVGHRVYYITEFGEVKVGQESQRTQSEWQYWRDDPLEEPRRE